MAALALAQTAKHSAGTRQKTADDAARTQLAAYMADFQRNPQDATLRSEIVELAKTINPAPAIPELARDDYAHATAQLDAATSPDEFKAAAKLFEQAAVQAPWYADADLNAATAYGKATDFDGARRNLALYMAAVRPGVDTRAAEDLGRGLDREQADLQFQRALQQFSASPTDAGRLQMIKLVQSMKTPPEIPEEARGHYVMAVVLVNSAEGDPGDEKRAIEEFKAALVAAPWWGDAYKKLATAQTAVGRYDDAIASLNLYLLTQPSESRNTQDEIYRLKALAQKDADERAKKQLEDQQRRIQEEKRQEERSAIAARKYTVEGRWYEASTTRDFFVGGQTNPDCDYVVKENGGHWTITNNCFKSSKMVDNVAVLPKQLSFRLLGHDPAYPFSEVNVSFTLSDDGMTLEGRGTAYDKKYLPLGDHPVRWMRRE